MDRIGFQKKLSAIFEQYKYVLLIVILGLVLMLWPSKKESNPVIQTTSTPEQQTSISEELSAILGQIRGVGRVRVMITEQSGAENHYQTDESGTENTDSITSDSQTVLITSGSSETGLIKSVSAPVYQGAIVVCQGADDPAVRLAVSQAVSSVTGISTDRISVLKMK